MMIPIPQAGLLKAVTGVAEASAVPHIETIEITAPLHYPVPPLPAGPHGQGQEDAGQPSLHEGASLETEPVMWLIRKM